MRFEDALLDVWGNFTNIDKKRVFGEEYEYVDSVIILNKLGQDEFMKRYETDKEVEINDLDMCCLDWTLNLLKKVDEDAYKELKRVKDNMKNVDGNVIGKRKFIYRKDR